MDLKVCRDLSVYLFMYFFVSHYLSFLLIIVPSFILYPASSPPSTGVGKEEREEKEETMCVEDEKKTNTDRRNVSAVREKEKRVGGEGKGRIGDILPSPSITVRQIGDPLGNFSSSLCCLSRQAGVRSRVWVTPASPHPHSL